MIKIAHFPTTYSVPLISPLHEHRFSNYIQVEARWYQKSARLEGFNFQVSSKCRGTMSLLDDSLKTSVINRNLCFITFVNLD